jgi:uncharacterized protein YbjT (DUF2867 family)
MMPIMRIAVAGGTGTVGRHVVTALTAAGHEPVVLARSRGVDVVTGAGLPAALDGVHAVVDVTNAGTTSRRKATDFFTDGTRSLLAAERSAGVAHHVLLSIVGIDRTPWGYYQAKLAQEQLLPDGGVPWSVLRATQFHEFPGQLLDRMPGPVAVVPTMRVQPVAAREVADVLAQLAAGQSSNGATDLAGPEQHDLGDLCRRLLAARGARRRVASVRLPGAAGRAMAGGGLLPVGEGLRGTVRFDDWLREPAQHPTP